MKLRVAEKRERKTAQENRSGQRAGERREPEVKIRAAVREDLEELMAFYVRMSRILDGADLLPQGNHGGFPSEELVRRSIDQERWWSGRRMAGSWRRI